MSEERLIALEARVQENRDRSDDQVETLYKRLDASMAPRAWWVWPAKVAAYSLVGMSVMAAAGTMAAYGLLPEGFVEDLAAVLATRARGG